MLVIVIVLCVTMEKQFKVNPPKKKILMSYIEGIFCEES